MVVTAGVLFGVGSGPLPVSVNGCRRLACGLLVCSLAMWFRLNIQPEEGLPTSTASGVLLRATVELFCRQAT